MTEEIERLIIAYVDNELEGDALFSFKQLLGKEPQILDRVKKHENLRQAIVKTYGSPPSEDQIMSLPDILNDLDNPDNIVSLPTDRIKGKIFGEFMNIPGWAALAATLVVGVVSGLAVPGFINDSDITVQNGKLVAQGDLGKQLNQQLASDISDGPVQIGLSFRSNDSICRTYMLEKSTAGLACKNGDTWEIRMTTLAGPTDESTEYRLAGSEFPVVLMAEVDKFIIGSPLDKEMEIKAREMGWEPKSTELVD